MYDAWPPHFSNRLLLHHQNVNVYSSDDVLLSRVNFNSYVHNVQKWPNILLKSCGVNVWILRRCKRHRTFKVCLAIFQHYVLKVEVTFALQIISLASVSRRYWFYTIQHTSHSIWLSLVWSTKVLLA